MSEIKTAISGSTQRLNAENEDFWKKALQISEKRLSVLASNIANADTPNYKARDIDFRAALEQALLDASPATDAVDKTKCSTNIDDVDAFFKYRVPLQRSVDGNTVDLDTEQSSFAEQAVKHQFMLQKVADEYREMDSMLKNLIG